MNIKKLRYRIDSIDKKLIKLLEKRFELSKKVGKYKKENKMKVQDKEREKEILDSRLKMTKMNDKFVKGVFELIMKESRRLQK